MTSIQPIEIELTEAQKNFLREQRRQNILSKLKLESEAVKVIKSKIAHYKKTGNKRKLAIYEAKLEDKKFLIPKLRSLIS